MSSTPTRVRYSVLALLCFLAMITYVDRAVIGSAKGDVMGSVGRSADDFFYLLVAFQLAYALCEVPAGWMGDVFGPRVTLLRIVLWWSAFIVITGLAGLTLGMETALIGFGTLVVVQFLFGMGEAGAFPNITKAVYNWFPASDRGFAKGAVWMSARFMGGLTPLIWLLLTEKKHFAGLDWRLVFFLFAGVAVLWCVVFFWWFRDRPEQHPRTNAAECELAGAGKPAAGAHAGVPWGMLVRSPNLWVICGMYFCGNYGWYFFMYFLPGFMKDQFGSKEAGAWDQASLALLTGGPLLLGMAGCYLGGILTDHFVRTRGRKWGRRVCGVLGFGLASASYLAAVAGAGNVWLFAGFIALAGFFNDLTMATSWATCQDVGRRFAAIVSGCMNMIGNLGAALTNYVTGKIIQAHQPEPASIVPVVSSGDPLGTTALVASMQQIQHDRQIAAYAICLTLYAVAFALGAVFWLFIDASKPVVPDESA